MDNPEVGQREKVLSAIRQASDLPAMADTVNIINRISVSEDASVSDLANILLKDYALTTKMLKVVNSVLFMQSGQVTTVSRAIFLLGIEHIKQIALTLMLFEQLQKQDSMSEVLEAIAQAFCGGVIAQKIVEDLNFVEEEEAFICALLHPLGRIIVAHAMPGKISEIRRMSLERKISGELASRAVLGISYEEIGTTIAADWNYPRKIVQSMHHMTGAEMPDNPQEEQKLGMIATLATEMANIIAADSEREEKEELIGKLLSSYKDRMPALPADIGGLIDSSVQEFNKLAVLMGLDLKKSSFSKQLDAWTGAGEPSLPEREVLAFRTDSLRTVDTLFEEEEENPEAVFSRGIQEINNAMLGPHSLNDVIHIALETIYRGMKVAQAQRALFFVRDVRRPRMEIRFGFGSSVNAAKSWFVILLEETNDVFNLAVSRDKDLLIRDVDSPEMRKFIPQAYRANMAEPGYMILFPVTVNKKNIGLICIEGDKKGFGNITRAVLSYLRILRDQIVTATMQSIRPEEKQQPRQ